MIGRVILAAVVVLLPGCGRDGSKPTGKRPISAATTLIREALPAFEAALGRSYPKPSPRMVKLRDALAGRDQRLAQTLLREELQANPDNTEAILISSQLLYQNAAMAAARPGFERILEHGPGFPGCQRVFYLYGSCLLRLGEGDAAREAFLAQLRLDPEHGEAYFSLGDLVLQQGDARRSLPHFQRALELFQTGGRKRGPFRRMDLARVHAAIASAHLQAGALDAARRSIGASLKQNPNAPQAHYTLSRILSRQGDADGARAALGEFKRLNRAASPKGH